MSHQFSSGERCSRCSSSRAAGRQSLMPLLAALVKSLISDSFSASPKCASTKKTGSQALSMQCPRPPSKTWHGHLIGTKSETELQPNTAPHIRSYSVNRSRNAEGDMISIAVGKFPAPWGGTWRRCIASRMAVPHLAVLAPDTPPLAAGCFIEKVGNRSHAFSYFIFIVGNRRMRSLLFNQSAPIHSFGLAPDAIPARRKSSRIIPQHFGSFKLPRIVARYSSSFTKSGYGIIRPGFLLFFNPTAPFFLLIFVNGSSNSSTART